LRPTPIEREREFRRRRRPVIGPFGDIGLQPGDLETWVPETV